MTKFNVEFHDVNEVKPSNSGIYMVYVEYNTRSIYGFINKVLYCKDLDKWFNVELKSLSHVKYWAIKPTEFHI